jgi:hypothetical protein
MRVGSICFRLRSSNFPWAWIACADAFSHSAYFSSIAENTYARANYFSWHGDENGRFQPYRGSLSRKVNDETDDARNSRARLQHCRRSQ